MDRKDQQQNARERRARLASWDEDGGAVASECELNNEREHEATAERAVQRADFDSSHQSSRRGEHRYPDAHQTTEERQGKDDRDALKRRLSEPR